MVNSLIPNTEIRNTAKELSGIMLNDCPKIDKVVLSKLVENILCFLLIHGYATFKDEENHYKSVLECIVTMPWMGDGTRQYEEAWNKLIDLKIVVVN